MRGLSGKGKLLGGLLTAALTVLAPASAQGVTPVSLKADYELQGSYSSSLGGGGAPDLTDIGAGNAFATDTVNGVVRQALTFPQGNGLDLAVTSPVKDGDYSVVMLFRLADVSGYRRILDLENGMSDDGLYAHNGMVDIFSVSSHPSATTVLSNDTYAEVALTDRAEPVDHSDVVAYVNGVQVAAYNATEGFKPFAGHIRFFKDDGSEESAGAVACIRVYEGTLSADQVSAIAADPSFCAAPMTQGPGPGPGSIGDTTPPNTKLKRKPAKHTGDDTPTFKFTSTEAGSSFKCRIDRKKFKPCRSPFTTKPLDSGKHTFRVDAVDPAGNADPTPAKFKFTVLP
jgi:hypothetical protein